MEPSPHFCSCYYRLKEWISKLTTTTTKYHQHNNNSNNENEEQVEEEIELNNNNELTTSTIKKVAPLDPIIKSATLTLLSEYNSGLGKKDEKIVHENTPCFGGRPSYPNQLYITSSHDIFDLLPQSQTMYWRRAPNKSLSLSNYRFGKFSNVSAMALSPNGIFLAIINSTGLIDIFDTSKPPNHSVWKIFVTGPYQRIQQIQINVCTTTCFRLKFISNHLLLIGQSLNRIESELSEQEKIYRLMANYELCDPDWGVVTMIDITKKDGTIECEIHTPFVCVDNFEIHPITGLIIANYYYTNINSCRILSPIISSPDYSNMELKLIHDILREKSSISTHFLWVNDESIITKILLPPTEEKNYAQYCLQIYAITTSTTDDDPILSVETQPIKDMVVSKNLTLLACTHYNRDENLVTLWSLPHLTMLTSLLNNFDLIPNRLSFSPCTTYLCMVSVMHGGWGPNNGHNSSTLHAEVDQLFLVEVVI
jgi:hypothetical protein